MSQRQRSQGPRSSTSTNITDRNTRSLAEKAVFWILGHGTSRAPIKHADLKKYVCPETKLDEPLRLAKDMLSNLYGYELVDLPIKTKSYVLINKLRRQEHITKSKETESKHVLLSIVLGYIFMNRQPVEQSDLIRFLEKQDISIKRNHTYFGNVNDLIFAKNATFVKDQYLEVISDEHGTFYQRGPRFDEEVNPRALLKFVSKMYGVEEDFWQAQLKDIEEMESNDERH